MSEDNPTPEEKAAAEAKAAALKSAQDKAVEANATRTGKGTRVTVGTTRGRATQVVSYEAFDKEQPLTLPVSLSEFMDLTKISDEPTIVGFLIDAFNDAQLATAADPTNAYVEGSWTPEFTKQFKFVIKNYSAATKMSIEDSVALLKPAMVAALNKA